MARKISEIYDAIIAYKEQQLFLKDLTPANDTIQKLVSDMNSSSKTAIWRLWAYITAVAIHTHEVYWDLFKADIEVMLLNGIVGTNRWYQLQVLNFQYGYNLSYNQSSGKYEYSTVDESSKIVKRCTVTEMPSGLLLIKVAKLDNGLPIPLNSTETFALQAYIKDIRFAGTLFQVITGNGDILRISLDIIYSALIPDTIIKENVEAAILSYISNLQFDGIFKVISLIDAIQSVDGVIDIGIQSGAIQVKNAISATYQDVLMSHISTFGYYKIDSTPGNTLNDTLNYYPS